MTDREVILRPSRRSAGRRDLTSRGNATELRDARAGLWLGAAAVVCWSFGSSLVYLGAHGGELWRFVCVASLTSGLLQLVARRINRGELRTALWLPWRLWTGPLLCFFVYGLVWPQALASATPHQVSGVNLINYLWPVLTVLFAAWWVPGARLSGRLIGAMFLACLGLVCANGNAIWTIFSERGQSMDSRGALVPYFLAALAAVTWAIYSALLARWKAWAGNYVTSPLGFLLIGLFAMLRLATKDEPGPSGVAALWPTLLYGIGPLGAGYLLWELALPRASVQALSVMAAATPILSTALLCVVLKQVPGLALIMAAVLVSAAVVYCVKLPEDNATQADQGA